MEEIKLPSVVQTLLLDTDNYKNSKARVIADRLCEKLFDDKFDNLDRKMLFEAFNYFDGMFKANTNVSYSRQWELFLECLIYTAGYYSKEQLKGTNQIVGLKDREIQMKAKIKSISEKAKELAELMRETDEFGGEHGFFEPDYDNPLKLMVRSAHSMSNKGDRSERETAYLFKQWVKPELQKALTFRKIYRPATINLIEELADISANEAIGYTSTTAPLQYSEVHEFNIFIDDFFPALDHLVFTLDLPEALFERKKYKYWVSIFNTVLDVDMDTKTVGDAIRGVERLS